MWTHGRAPSLIFWASLLLLISFLTSHALAQSCRTCEFQAGVQQGALDFRGSSLDQKTSLVLSTATSDAIKASETPLSFTLEAWVWPAQANLRRPQPLFARYPRTQPIQGHSRAEFLLQVQANGNLNLFFGGGSANKERLALNLDCGFNVVPAGRWTHVALSVATTPGLVNPREARVYLNGHLACEWPGTEAANTTFAGTRQIMHDQPFVFSKYELANCDGPEGLQTFHGRMDELRVWAGVRTPAEILAAYDTTDLSSTTTTTPYAEARASSLVGLFHLDRETSGEGEEAAYVALDSSPTGANAEFEGEGESEAPAWVPSSAPLVLRVEATNFLLAQLNLFIYSADVNDTFGAQIDVSALNPTESIYRDGGAAVLLNQGNVITVAEGSQFPVAYFLTTSPVSYTATVRYRAVSYDVGAQSALVASEWAEIVVRVEVTGCDGQGGEIDWCGVCEGDGRCEPYGCDGEGSRLDVCGVCDGFGESCRCSLANWRGYQTEELDKSVLFYDLAHLNEAMEAMKSVADEVTSLLLESDERRISCANVTTALANVKRLQAKTYIYNTLFLEPFLEMLS